MENSILSQKSIFNDKTLKVILYFIAALYLAVTIFKFFTPNFLYQFGTTDINFIGVLMRFISYSGIIIIALVVFFNDSKLIPYVWAILLPAYLIGLPF